MRGVVDDLQQQVDQLEGILSLHTVLHVCALHVYIDELNGLKKEAGQLRGEKAALQRESDKLRAQVFPLILLSTVKFAF